jgi:uncharacterized damage-inducible protein DinB
MKLPAATLRRLETQLQALPIVLGDATLAEIGRRPPSGKWSARENLAHLARHHQVFLERLERILKEDRPRIDRYRAEDDPEWPRWSEKSTASVLARLHTLRARIVKRVRALTPAQAERVGIHSSLGPMSVARWVEFFLVHEAHHLYVIMGCLGATRPGASSGRMVNSVQTQ